MGGDDQKNRKPAHAVEHREISTLGWGLLDDVTQCGKAESSDHPLEVRARGPETSGHGVDTGSSLSGRSRSRQVHSFA
jgi:hypothetical protein